MFYYLTPTSSTPGIRVITCGAEKCVSWPGRPLGGTENFGVSPALPIGRELKRLRKPLQKSVRTGCARDPKVSRPAPRLTAAARLTTHRASRARALGARPAGPSVRRGANHRAGRGRVVRGRGGAGRYGHGLPLLPPPTPAASRASRVTRPAAGAGRP